MYYGDFSRMAFSRRKNYSSVWAQQGRVQLDADINEQTAILLDYLRTLAADFIGPFGGPAGQAGFRITLKPSSDHEIKHADLRAGPGHYYVGGLRCEAEGSAVAGPLSWRHQPRGEHPRGDLPDPPFLVWLQVWENSVGALQDPGLLEPALGLNPPDTTLRSQVAWEIMVADSLPGRGRHRLTGRERRQQIVDAFADLAREPVRPGLLQARAMTAAGDDASAGPARYRGASSQLYRVEIHTGGPAGRATFKWSREFGSVTFGIESLAGDAADLRALGRDTRTDLEVGDWVEIIDDRWVPAGNPPPLLQVATIDRASRRVTLDGAETTPQYRDAALHPLLRRWDQQPGRDSRGPDNALRVTQTRDEQSRWLDLEEGIQIQFPRTQGVHHYQRGDYWQIPARTTTGDLLWPTDQGEPVAMEPFGPPRYAAPLALVRSPEPEDVVDLRSRFVRLAWPDEDGEGD